MENFILTFGIPEEACDALVEYHKENKYDKTSTEQMWTKEQKGIIGDDRVKFLLGEISYSTYRAR